MADTLLHRLAMRVRRQAATAIGWSLGLARPRRVDLNSRARLVEENLIVRDHPGVMADLPSTKQGALT